MHSINRRKERWWESQWTDEAIGVLASLLNWHPVYSFIEGPTELYFTQLEPHSKEREDEIEKKEQPKNISKNMGEEKYLKLYTKFKLWLSHSSYNLKLNSKVSKRNAITWNSADVKLYLEAENRGKQIEKTKPKLQKYLKLYIKACFGYGLMVLNVQATIVEVSKFCFHLIFF